MDIALSLNIYEGHIRHRTQCLPPLRARRWGALVVTAPLKVKGLYLAIPVVVAVAHYPMWEEGGPLGQARTAVLNI